MITGTGVHDRPEFMFTINWNRCSRSSGMRVHDVPERALTRWIGYYKTVPRKGTTSHCPPGDAMQAIGRFLWLLAARTRR
jgi:hypothetical protein